MFRFTAHPATIGVTQGVQIAFAYLRESWRRWLPMVVVVALVSVVLYAVVYSLVLSPDFQSLYYVNRYTDRVVWNQVEVDRLLSLIPAFLALGTTLLVLNLVAGWVFTATAISGLRNRPLTVSRIVGPGLLTLVAWIVIGAAVFGAFLVCIVLAVVVPPVGALVFLVLFFGGFPVGIYLAFRLSFFSFALFDGFGLADAFRESWRLTRQSVGRIFGWGLMSLLLSFGFGFLATALSGPFSFSGSGAAAVGSGLSAAATLTGSCLMTFLMAILYESQRARFDPTLYGPPPAPVYAAYGYPGYGYPGYPGGPYPYAPGPNPTGPSASPIAWSGAPDAPTAAAAPTAPAAPAAADQGAADLPYANAQPGYAGSQPPRWQAPDVNPPRDSTAIPGWVNPNAPQGWPAYPPTYPGWGAPPAPQGWPGYPPANTGWGAPPAPQGWPEYPPVNTGWGAPPAPQGWPGYPPVNPNVPPAWGPGSNVAPGTVPDASPAAPPSEPKPTDPPPAG